MKSIVPVAVVLMAVAAPAWSGRDAAWAAERDGDHAAAPGGFRIIASKGDGDSPASPAAGGELPVAGRDLFELHQRVGGRWIPLADGAWRGAGYDGRLLGYKLAVGRHHYEVWVAGRVGRIADYGVKHLSTETGETCREVYQQLLGAFKDRGIVPRRFKGLRPPRPGRGAAGARVSVRRTALPGRAQFEARFERNRGRCKVSFQYITRFRPGGGAPNR